MFDQLPATHGYVQVVEDNWRYVEQESPGGRCDGAERTAGRTISDSVDEQLAAIADLFRGLPAATATYRDRPLDWSDVASLMQVREYLGRVVRALSSAEAADALHRAARQVATEVRQFRRWNQHIDEGRVRNATAAGMKVECERAVSDFELSSPLAVDRATIENTFAVMT